MGNFELNQDVCQGYKNWLSSLKDHPDIVWYSLKPMFELMTNEKQKEAMKDAIEQYITQSVEEDSLKEPQCSGNIDNVASNCCPQQPWRGTLDVKIIRAWDLYGDWAGTTDA